ncbi:MAG: carbohydrate binding domain-containing protein, partial [Limisphaerales bacterium]
MHHVIKPRARVVNYSQILTESAAIRLGVFGAALLCSIAATAANNLLKNPGFEESGSSVENPPGWVTRNESAGKASVTDKETHSGRNALTIPANTAVEQKVSIVAAGAYMVRCWVKSESDQTVTILLEDPDRPWAAYNCAEVKVPAGQWTQIESFCALDQQGSLTLTLGGMSKEFRLYHGTSAELKSPILADDVELVRYEPARAQIAVWDVAEDAASLDWSTRDKWRKVESSSTYSFAGTPVIQGRHMVGAARANDGGLSIYCVQDGKAEPRCAIVPTPALSG